MLECMNTSSLLMIKRGNVNKVKESSEESFGSKA